MNPPLPFTTEDKLAFGHTFRVAQQLDKIHLAEAIMNAALEKVEDLKIVLYFTSGGNTQYFVKKERFRYAPAKSK